MEARMAYHAAGCRGVETAREYAHRTPQYALRLGLGLTVRVTVRWGWGYREHDASDPRWHVIHEEVRQDLIRRVDLRDACVRARGVHGVEAQGVA